MKVNITTNWIEDGQSSDREVADFNEIKDLLSQRDVYIIMKRPPATFQIWVDKTSKCNVIYFEQFSPVQYFLYPDSYREKDMDAVKESEKHFKSDFDLMLNAAEFFFVFGRMKPGLYWHEFETKHLTDEEREFMESEIQRYKALLKGR